MVGRQVPKIVSVLVILTEGILPSREHLAMSEDNIRGQDWRCSIGIQWVEPSDSANHPAVHRTVNKDLFGPTSAVLQLGNAVS